MVPAAGLDDMVVCAVLAEVIVGDGGGELALEPQEERKDALRDFVNSDVPAELAVGVAYVK